MQRNPRTSGEIPSGAPFHVSTPYTLWAFVSGFFFFFLIFIYLAVWALSCSTWDLVP